MTEGPTHWRCTACDKTTKVKSHMVDHVESRHVLVPTECPYCNRIFKSRGNCRSHISAIHKEEHRTYGFKLFQCQFVLKYIFKIVLFIFLSSTMTAKFCFQDQVMSRNCFFVLHTRLVQMDVVGIGSAKAATRTISTSHICWSMWSQTIFLAFSSNVLIVML